MFPIQSSQIVIPLQNTHSCLERGLKANNVSHGHETDHAESTVHTIQLQYHACVLTLASR